MVAVFSHTQSDEAVAERVDARSAVGGGRSHPVTDQAATLCDESVATGVDAGNQSRQVDSILAPTTRD